MIKTLSTNLGNSKCGQGKNFFFQPPTFNIENRRQKKKLCFESCLDLHAQSWNNFYFVRPPTFNIESRRPNAKHLVLAMLKLQAQSLETQTMTKAKNVSLNLLL
jgi:hypothetical protein